MKSNDWSKISVLVAALALLLVGGCGEGGKESPHRGLTAAETAARGLGTDSAGHDYVGTDRCLECHLDGAATCSSCHSRYSTGLSTVEAAAYLESGHVNHSDRIDASAETASCRAACHDPVGDGPLIENRVAAVPARGLAVVGCEACHGGGALHFGSRGSIPVAAPDFEVCGGCHDELSPLHTEDHPEGVHILATYQSSGHARSVNEHTQVAEGSADTTAVCSKCHSDQGAKAYKDTAPVDIPYSSAPVKGAVSVQCRTCHDSHNPDALLMAETDDASAEYRTCTMCHQTSAGYHGADSDYSWSGYSVGVGTFDAGRIIDDTHFDDPATDGIEGYNIKATSHRACRSCHDVHAADPTINEQWAKSGHAGRVGLLKAQAAEDNPGVGADEAIRSAAVTPAGAGAWTYYPWKDGSYAPPWGGPATDLTPCQRCHTTTGFTNYTTDPVRYNPLLNDYSYLSGMQKELLYCSGCHANNAGGLREPGAIPFDYPGAATGAYPDVLGSNLCVGCHSGLANGATVRAQSGLSNHGPVSPHYLAAGGVLFGGTADAADIGYEFAGRDYAVPAEEKHFLVGMPDDLDVPTGSQGPCVGCHLSSAEPHTLEVLAHDPATGAVTEIQSTVCAACHKAVPGLGDFTLSPAGLEDKRSGFRAALAALKQLLLDQGYGVQDDYPYFTRTNWGNDDEAGYNDLGAAFNYALLSHEPGAYVHNRYYAKRLLFDTIDWVANGVLDGEISSALSSLPASPTFTDSFADAYDLSAARAYLDDLGL